MNDNTVFRSLLAAAMLFTLPGLHAQSLHLSTFSAGTATGDPAAALQIFSPATAAMVANRARTLGNQASGSGEKYLAATDRDLEGLTPKQKLARLSPPTVTAGDGVRKLQIYIDLHKPLLIEGSPGQPVSIGTADLQGRGVREVEVHASIFLSGVEVLNQ